MHYRRLIEFFESRRQNRQPMVLATVIETCGSTYSKPGACMLIDQNGIFKGMLSGGCLEGDLAIRARQVIESGRPQIVSYDLSDDNDELWGLGVGCDGLMRVFLQPLTDGNSYEPFVALVDVLSGTERGIMAIVVSSDVDRIAAGASLVQTLDSSRSFGLDADVIELIRTKYEELLTMHDAGQSKLALSGGEIFVFYSVVAPVPRILILGAGLDAEPVISFAAELGWRCTVVDHRPANIDNNEFAAAEQKLCCPAEEVSTALDLDLYDMAVVMSHHIASDRSYLRQLADTDIAYIGLLGPEGRRQRLFEELGDVATNLVDRVHGPAGIDLGGQGPAAIALSIAAEMQRVLAGR
ncbi:MAG: XdhC family protein [Gammaproteobacteria bacterium]|nr:XdhC family protein [Gammaproteobacteria bacterium]